VLVVTKYALALETLWFIIKESSGTLAVKLQKRDSPNVEHKEPPFGLTHAMVGSSLGG